MNTERIRRMAAALWAPTPIGSLCDETPEPIDGRYAPRKDEDGPDASDITALRAENAALRARLGRDADGTRREAILRQQLAEVTADRDAISAYNDRLRARVLGLELTVRSLGAQDGGSQWIGSADTVPMPRVRSYPAPGLAIDVTQPGDDGDLLIGRPW